MYQRSNALSFAAALRDIQASQAKARVIAAERLGRAGNEHEREQALEALAPAIADARPEVRSTACMSLAELERPEAWELMAQCLEDTSPEVRQSAAISLGTLGAPESFELLAQTLKSGSPDLRFQVATSIAEVDLERAYEPLLEALDDDDPEVLGSVALSLGAIGNAACADRIAELLDHARAQTRLDAAYALAQLGDQRALETLAAALYAEDGAWDAVIGLEGMGAPSIPALRAFLQGQDGVTTVRLRAAGSLLALTPKEDSNQAARRCLTDGLRSRKPEIRGLALQEIHKHGGAWALPALDALRASFRARHMRADIDRTVESLQAQERKSR